jgi:hypothetical protein
MSLLRMISPLPADSTGASFSPYWLKDFEPFDPKDKDFELFQALPCQNWVSCLSVLVKMG